MKVKIKKGFEAEYKKSIYDVIAVSEDLNYAKIINDEGQEDWLGMYMIQDLISCKSCFETYKRRRGEATTMVCGLCKDFDLWTEVNYK